MTEQQLREEIAQMFTLWCISSSYYWGLQERLVELVLKFAEANPNYREEAELGGKGQVSKLKN